MEFSQEQKLYASIVQKAWEDADFKNELTANPVAAIENLTGKKLNLPAGKKLVVGDQTDETTVYINIPAQPAVDAELNEEQLEAVAGGNARLPSDIFPFPGGTGPYNPIEDILKPLTTI